MTLPVETQKFLRDLYDHLWHRNTDGLQKLYEHDFQAVSEKHYSGSELWPTAAEAAEYYREMGKEHQLVLHLYQWLYLRHAFGRGNDSITWSNRLIAWPNYLVLFEFFLGNEYSDELENRVALPLQWLWDMFDEFVNQFVESQRRKWKLIHSIANQTARPCSEEENDSLTTLWDPRTVLNIVYSFVATSKINETLQRNKGVLPPDASPGDYLGYFATIALLKLNNMVCDYGNALECVQHVQLGATSTSLKVPACHTTLHYNLAFAQMMSKRYVEAAKTASQILTLSTKSKSYFAAVSPMVRDAMDQSLDKLYTLIIICDYMSHDVKPDEFIMSKIRESYRDRLYKLQGDNEEAFFELFKRVCPDFVSPACWNQEMRPELVQMQQSADILQRQASVFMKDVGQQRRAEQLLSFAKLYNNVSLSKLAALMNLQGDSDQIKEIVRAELLSVRVGGAHNPRSAPVVDFIVDDDSVHVMTQPPNDIFINQYIKQNQRVQELLNTVQSIDMTRIQLTPAAIEAERA